MFIGGAPIYTNVDTAEGTTSTTYAALATAGPTITVPLAGDYLVEIGSHQYGTSNSGNQLRYHSYDVGGTGAADVDACVSHEGSANEAHDTPAQARKHAGVAASTAFVSKYMRAGSSSSTVTFKERWMKITPIAVRG